MGLLTYNSAIEYINGIHTLNAKLALTRMHKLLDALGNPEKGLKVIQVAGTNGKGSTCMMLSEILIASGLRVGLITSPHLSKFNERYKLNGVDMSDEEFLKYTEMVKEKCDEIVEESFPQPSIFEVITAIGLCYFSEQPVDIIVIEVGIGGRLDATNVFDKSILSIITSISFDHMDILGKSIKEIANQKGGIIKMECPTVLCVQQFKEVVSAITSICKKYNSLLYYCEEINSKMIRETLTETVFSLKSDYYNYESITLKMIGEYQIINTHNVLLAVEALRGIGYRITKEHVLEGLKNSFWAGRMEVIKTDPCIILDGAHNVGGVEMLSVSVKKFFPANRVIVVTSILREKEHDKILKIMEDFASKIILTETKAATSRCVRVDDLNESIKRSTKLIYKEPEWLKAIHAANNLATKRDVIIYAGSLFLVANVRQYYSNLM